MPKTYAKDRALNDVLTHLSHDPTIPGVRRTRYFNALERADRNFQILADLREKLNVDSDGEIEAGIDGLLNKVTRAQAEIRALQKAQRGAAATSKPPAKNGKPRGQKTDAPPAAVDAVA